MNAIEPVQFEIEGTDIDLPKYTPRLHPRVTDWDEVHDFILHESTSNKYREFSRDTVYEKFRDVIADELQGASSHIPNLVDKYQNIPQLPFRGGINPIYYRDGITLVPNPEHNGLFYMLGDNKEHLRDAKQTLVDDLHGFKDTYRAMGLENINIYHGSEFTLNILRSNENVNEVQQDDFDNDFEERCYRSLEPFSEAFVNNITVSFRSPQEPEYDTLFSLAPSKTLSIEVENHAGTDSNPSESDVIDDPSSEAGYINAECVFTIINGVDRDLVSQFGQKSELTGVRILEEEQCPETIIEYIEQELIQSALNLGSRPAL